MTKENYQNDCYNFDNLVKSIIQNSGVEINLDLDFRPVNQLNIQICHNTRQFKRFKKFIEMCKNRRFSKKLANQIKETVDKKYEDEDENEDKEKENLTTNLPLNLIHSVVEKNNINEKYYKRFMIPLNILMGLKNNRTVEYAIENIILEKECQYGLYCPYKCNPLKCPLNHHEMSYKMIDDSKVIIQGDSIPNLFCLYERPWKVYKNTNVSVRCTNPYCWYNHAIGRAKLITNNGYYKYAF